MARVIRRCPGCGTNVATDSTDAPLTLPADCPNCQELAATKLRSVEEVALPEHAGLTSPAGLTSGEVAALRRNIALLQGDVSRLTTKCGALSGDLADMRRLMDQHPPAAVRHPLKVARRR